MPAFPFRSRSPRNFVLRALFVLLFVASCGDPSGPGTEPVATVVLSAAPEAPLRVGSTAQLVATALSASGSVISGAQVVWKSSNEAVASVSGGGLVTAAGGGKTTIAATSGRGTAAIDVFVVAPLTLSSAGGITSLPDGSLSLEVPPGQLVRPITFLVAPAPDEATEEGWVPGTTHNITLEEDAGAYIPGVTVTVRYDPAQLPRGVSAGGLQLYAYTEQRWRPIEGSVSDPGTSHVSGRFHGVGLYAVRPTPVGRVALEGALLDGALYVTQTTEFKAAAITELGDTLHNAELSWSTTAADVASVDDAGMVTAVSPGTATISVTSGEITASTRIDVLERPVAEWPAPGDWLTYRGNNRRTGFVDATLDPLAFTRVWEASLPPGALNEPATGDGNIYLSTHSHFGEQALWALDAATGAIRWTRAFGNIHSVNGPATADGRVYVSTGGHTDSFLWSFDAADGTLHFRSPYENQWSRWLAPAIENGIVYLGGGYFGGIYAFTSFDGVQLWSLSLPQLEGWTPAVDERTAYAFNDEGLLAINASSGDTTVNVANQGLPPAGTPVVDGESVYVNGGGRLIALDLARDMEVWSTPGGYQEVPVIDDDNLYAVADGQVEVRDRRDGSLAWTWTPQAGSTAAGSLIVTRNLLFVQILNPYEEKGRVIALDLRARKAVWSYEEGGQIALANGMLIITSRSTGKVVAIEVD